MWVQLVPSWHRAQSVPELHWDCDRFPAQPVLSRGSPDADCLRPWTTMSSTTLAVGGTEVAAGAAAVAAVDVAADPSAGGADAQL